MLADQSVCVGRAVIRQLVCRPLGAGVHFVIHRDGEEFPLYAVRNDFDRQRFDGDRAQFAGTLRRVPAGIRVYVLDSDLHGFGLAPGPLIDKTS